MATVEHGSSSRCKRHVVSRCVQVAPCSKTKKSLIAILGFSLFAYRVVYGIHLFRQLAFVLGAPSKFLHLVSCGCIL